MVVLDKNVKAKLIMFLALIGFMALYLVAFGSKNMVIGITIVLAAFMSLGNDLSFKPKTSFIKVFGLLLILGIVSFLNNPITIIGCILTFLVVFATTFTSYHLFSASVYMPYLMCYLMMLCVPVSIEEFPMRLLSLFFGAIFIVGLNILINSKKDYKLSKATINKLLGELNNAVDLKLEGNEVSTESFKTVTGFYSSLLNKFEYKYFPNKTQESVLVIIKAFQSIGNVLANYDLSKNELLYIKEILSKIKDVEIETIFTGIDIESKQIPVVLLNMEIIANEIHKDLIDDSIIPDRKTVFNVMMP